MVNGMARVAVSLWVAESGMMVIGKTAFRMGSERMVMFMELFQPMRSETPKDSFSFSGPRPRWASFRSRGYWPALTGNWHTSIGQPMAGLAKPLAGFGRPLAGLEIGGSLVGQVAGQMACQMACQMAGHAAS